MTNKEAIKILQDNKGAVVMDSEFEQAYNMAINALETSCDNCPLSAENNDNDLISRKAVLDKLQENQDFYINAYGDRFDFRDLAPKDEKARVDEIGIIRSIVNELPTIPPLSKGGKVENGKLYIEGEHEEELISKKAVLDLFDDYVGEKQNYIKVWNKVAKLPTIPQTDSETEYWKDLAKSYERTIVALQKGIAETQTDSVLEDIKAEIDNESIGYPPSADYYKAIKKAVRIVEKHISGKEEE